MVEFKQKQKYNVQDLLEVVRLLRSPDGCPWDREQTHESIRQGFIEEVYEVVEAIDTNDSDLLCEELGDVLLQVVMHTQMETETGVFGFDDVVDNVCKKMIIRHPHVFGNTVAEDTETVLKNWDEIKMYTKSQKTQGEAMQDVPKSLPALMRGEKLLKKAAKNALAFNDTSAAFKRAEKALGDLKTAYEKNYDETVCSKNLGALLLSIIDVSGCLRLGCEKSLYYTCDDFVERFVRLEKIAEQNGIDIQNLNPKDLDLLWSDEFQKK